MPPETNIIYVVTSGVYSDYRIEAIFSNKDEAQHLANTITENSWNECVVEEYPLDRYDRYGINKLCFWNFTYYSNKADWSCEFNTDKTQWQGDKLNKVVKSRQGDDIVYYVITRGATREEAQKIANEKVMMFIAKGK